MIPDAAYYGDCFDIISKWENEGVKEVADLIYGDPPFNSNRNYGAPTSKAQETDTGSMDAFVDMWTYDDKAIARTKRICKSVGHPASKLIQSLKDWLEEEDDGMLAPPVRETTLKNWQGKIKTVLFKYIGLPVLNLQT